MKLFYVAPMIVMFFISLENVVFAKEVQTKSAIAEVKIPESERIKLAKNTLIEINKYDSHTDTFEITIVKESAVGPNYVLSKDLYNALALKDVSFEKFTKMKNDYIGSQFTTTKIIPLLEQDEVNALYK